MSRIITEQPQAIEILTPGMRRTAWALQAKKLNVLRIYVNDLEQEFITFKSNAPGQPET